VDSPAELIDLDCYPITDLQSPRGQAMVDEIKRNMSERVICSLPGFLRPEALVRMVKEAEGLESLSYVGPSEASPYFFNYGAADLATLPADHPRLRKTPRRMRQIAYDLIPPSTAIWQLYNWDPLTAFLAAATGNERLYRSADPFQALNISVMDEGGRQQWHFDTNEVNITLLLQAPEQGGEFEYVPLIRSSENENFDKVKAILDGSRDGVIQLQQEAGSLVLFKGHNSLHRVAPVQGSRRRFQTILAHNPKPGVVGSRASSILHYGERVAQL
jgi:2OG-Fe(II) oxygenase superfamily